MLGFRLSNQPMRLLILCSLVGFASFAAEETRERPLGPIGGTYRVTPGVNYVRVTSVTSAAPGATAGLKVNDLIHGAFGKEFTPTGEFHSGVTQELGYAIDRAEGSDGVLPLKVLRPGAGDLVLTVNLPVAGAYGPAYPLNSAKFSAMYESACTYLHTTALSSSGNLGYLTGWSGLCLLGHPNWNDLTGAKPYRLSINIIRDYAVAQINAALYAPVEDKLIDGSANPNYVGGAVSNWYLGGWVMFLSEYRAKSGDTSVDAAIQRGAEICSNTVQWWKQPALNANGYSPEYANIAGIVSHGGVTGDYIHLGWGGGINICGVHSFNGLAFAKRAGSDMTVRPRDGHYFGYATCPTGVVPPGMENYDHALSEKFTMCWEWMVGKCGGWSPGDIHDGHVCYTVQGWSSYDAGGRTPAALLGMLLYQNGAALNTTDADRVSRMKNYVSRNYMQHQDAHAFVVGAVGFQQMVAPFLSDRQLRYFMDNWRFSYALSHSHTGGFFYFPSRNVADNYLNETTCGAINCVMPLTVASGGLPHIPGYNTARIFANFTSPNVTWPRIEARYVKTSTATLNMPVTIHDGQGAAITPTSVAWTKLIGPGSVTFSAPNAATTDMTFSQTGKYQVQLAATSGAYSVTEPLDVDVQLTTPPVGYQIGVVNYDVYTGISGTTVASLTSAAKYPASPDVSHTLTKMEGDYSGDNYGARITGLVIPPVTGSYVFYIASDDNSQLKLNTNGTSASGATVIATVGNWTNKYEWTKYTSQKSTTLNLTAGVPLYIEALQKEATGGDNLSVGWSINGGAIEVIDGVYLAAPVAPAATSMAITQHPQPASTTMGGNVTLSITATGPSPAVYQWRRNGVNVGPPSTEPTLAMTNVSGGADADYDCVYTTPLGTLTSNSAHVTITDAGAIVAGGLWREVYSLIDGSAITDLTSATVFPYFADVSGVITSAAAPSSYGDSYGQRITGWIKPTVSGNYRFYLTSDDASELWLSVDEYRAHKVKLTQVNGYTGDKSWSSVTPSAYVPLVAGQRYYVEVLHKEGGGGDHVAFAWQKEGDAAPVNGSGEVDASVLEYRVGGYYADPVPVPAYTKADAMNAIATVATSLDVLANDIDLDNASLVLQSVTQGASGSVAISGRNVIYTGQPGFVGNDTFTYTVLNSQGQTAIGTVIVKVGDPYSGLLGWWRLNENTGNTTADTSGNGNNATLSAGTTWTTGKFGSGILISANSQWAVTTTGKTTPSTFTIAAWINPTNASGIDTILTLGSNVSFRTNGSRLRLTTYGFQDHDSGTSMFSGNVWTHVAVTFTPSTSDGVKFYVNGVLRSTLASSAITTGTGAWKIGGATTASEYFAGSLDEVRLYNRILNPAEIATLANASLFDDWRAIWFSPGELGNSLVSGANATTPNGGLTVLGAYAFGLNPRATNGPASVWSSSSSGTRYFNYHRRKAPHGLTFTEKTSTDLINWNIGTLTTTSVTDDGNGTTETVTLQPVTPPGTKMFFKVEATHP